MNDIYVAKLGRTIGLKGEMKIFIDSDFPEQFTKGATFTTNKKTSLTIKSINSNKQTVSFEEINDVDEAKKFTNATLFTSLEDTRDNCSLKEGEHFWFDIIDCEVYEGDLLLGKVKDIQRLPVSDYLEIKTDENLVKEGLSKLFLLPYDKTNFIENVSIEQKKIFVKDAKAILENS